jgi:uridine kinase
MNNVDSTFRIRDPRADVEVHLSDGRVINGSRNSQIGEFFRVLPLSDHTPIVGAIVNGELRELTYPIKLDSQVRPVTMGEPDGMRIYRRSLVFLLETAFLSLFPGFSVRVDHSVAHGGYYCRVSNHPPLTEYELEELENKMFELVKADKSLKRHIIPLDEAMAYFKKAGEQDKIRLLAHRHKDYLTIYELDGTFDYHHGYMVPSTGYLRWFKLSPAGEGFTLRFPRRQSPTEIRPLPEYKKLRRTFRQYGSWLRRLGISSVGALNDSIVEDRIIEIILVSEALHEQRVTEIAYQIFERIDKIRVVLIAGPSSSGKTIFSKRLSVQLLAYGVSPFSIEMDNYFVDRDKTPLDENGKPDFETINALDRIKLSKHLSRLIAGEQVQLPKYNFVTGKRELGDKVQLKTGEIIILEGIHGLHPELLTSIPEEQTFRIYVSALTQLNLDRHNRISTTDTRLIRRISRDANSRGYTAQQTIQRWESVRRGEKRNIFPYQENADVMFNSALAYELSALKPYAEPLIRQVPYGTPEHVEAKRLLALLDWFLPISSDLIPDNSILREFLGGSILQKFSLWHNNS